MDERDIFAGMDKAQLKACLSDPMWRLRNLYKIKTKDEEVVTFTPNEQQQKLLDNIWYRNIIPKARQRGFSTLIQLMALDRCLFVAGSNAVLTAQTRDDAKKIRDGKIMFAYDRLPATIKMMVPLIVKNESELRWANGSIMAITSSARGGTIDFLHISEYGKTCLQAPDKAKEIQEGSLPAAERGITFIESTVESNFGIFADMVRRAESVQQQGRKLSRLDYRLHFASWWDADEYEEDPALVPISPKDHAYFDLMEAEIGRQISPRKRAWYVAKRDSEFGGQADKMWRQYPTTMKEAFQVSTEGLWLAVQMAKARLEGRICRLPLHPDIPVNTFWDLGVDDDMAIWCHQRVGAFDHWVKFFEGSGEPLAFYVKQLNEWAGQKGIVWGTHYLPHDGNQRRPGSETLKTYVDMLNDLGLKNIEIIPRIPELSLGIDQMRDAIAGYRFDDVDCKEGIAHLDGYSKKWNERHGVWSSQVEQNGHQHAADALRQHGQNRHNMRSGEQKKDGWKRSRPSAMGA